MTMAPAAEAVLARRTILARAGNIHGDLAALKILVVEHFNRLLRLFRRGEFDERKAAGTAGHLVHHQVARCDCARLGEVILEVIFARLKGQVADE